MDDERSFCYTLILGVCIIICCLLIGKMVFFRPTSISDNSGTDTNPSINQPREATIVMTDAELSKLFQDSLSDDLPIENIGIKLQGDGTAKLSGEVSGEKVTKMLENRVLSKFIPKTCQAEAIIEATVADGKVTFHTRSASIAGVSLSENINDKLSNLLTERFHQNIEHIQDIRISEGKIEIWI